MRSFECRSSNRAAITSTVWSHSSHLISLASLYSLHKWKHARTLLQIQQLFDIQRHFYPTNFTMFDFIFQFDSRVVCPPDKRNIAYFCWLNGRWMNVDVPESIAVDLAFAVRISAHHLQAMNAMAQTHKSLCTTIFQSTRWYRVSSALRSIERERELIAKHVVISNCGFEFLCDISLMSLWLAVATSQHNSTKLHRVIGGRRIPSSLPFARLLNCINIHSQPIPSHRVWRPMRWWLRVTDSQKKDWKHTQNEMWR